MIKKRKSVYKKIVVIIPAFNEELSLSHIVHGVLSLPFVYRCVVVDDGSTDKTAAVAKKSGATVISHHINKGSGVAVRTGLRYAVKIQADTIVIMDADGQHDPKYIPELLKNLSGRYAYIIASRYMKSTPQSTQKMRAVATKTISHLFWHFLNIRIFDPTSGFRAMNYAVAQRLAGDYPLVFPEPEIVLYLHEEKISMKEISIPMYPRIYGASTITVCKGIYLFGYICVKAVLSLGKYR